MTRRTLPSGVRIIVREMPGAPTVALDIRARAGSADDDPAHPGAAHFLEHAFFKGSETKQPGEIDAAIEAVGGEVDARTSRDWTQFAVTLPAGDTPWRIALQVLGDTLQHPALRPADLDAERGVVKGEIAWAESEPLRLGYSDIYAAAFAGADDPYHHPLMGTPEQVAALTPDDLRAFWSAHYRPSDLTVTVAGDVHAADVVAAVGALFPGISDVKSAPVNTAVDAEPPAGVVRGPRPARQADRDLATVVLGFRTPETLTGASEMPSLDVLMPLLADEESPGVGRGRLFDALVTKQKLALTVSAEFLPGRHGGLIVVTATGAKRDAVPLENALVRELDRLTTSDPPTPDEIAAARASALGSVRFAMQSPTEAARRLASLDALDLPTNLIDGYEDRLAAVTGDDLHGVLLRRLTTGRCAVVVIDGNRGSAAGETATP